MNETMYNWMLQLFEVIAQPRNELLASGDKQNKLMKITGGMCCEKAQLKEQPSMAKETNEEQATCINQLEEEKSLRQLLLDNATMKNYINDMKKQLHQAKEELKEEQEKRAKTEKELRQKQLELDNRTKQMDQQRKDLDNMKKQMDQQKKKLENMKRELEQQKEELDNRMKKVEQREQELDNRKKELNTREQHLNEEKKKDVAKLNTCTEECSTKQEEYDEVINVLLKALADYGKYAKDVLKKLNRNSTGYHLSKWRSMHRDLIINYNSTWLYLKDNLTNNVFNDKKLKDTIEETNFIPLRLRRHTT